MVKRRVGQHHADVRAFRGNRLRNGSAWTAPQQNDRALWAREQVLFVGSDKGELGGHLDIADHQRERFVDPVLTLAQSQNRSRRCGVTRQVETPETFHSDDLSA